MSEPLALEHVYVVCNHTGGLFQRDVNKPKSTGGELKSVFTEGATPSVSTITVYAMSERRSSKDVFAIATIATVTTLDRKLNKRISALC